MAEEQTDMFDDLDDDQERAEVERILRETAELDEQRRAENRQFQDELRAQLGLPAKQRGGAREGAGRKPKSPVAASKVVRIPEQYEAAVRALVAHLDASAKLGRHYGPTTSDPVFVRSLYGKAQHVTFTVAPLKP